MKERTHLIKTFLMLLLVLTGISCRQVFYPDDLENPERILSVNGRIQEDSLPVVKLSWTAGYYEQNEIPEQNARVTISDETGHVVTLFELNKPGLYTTDDINFKGKVGSTYTLNIVTDEGNRFYSNPVTMPVKPEVDTFFMGHKSETINRYTTSGKLITTIKDGMTAYTYIISSDPTEKYYRFRTRTISEIVYTKWPSSMMNTTGYIWNVGYADDLYNIDKTVLFDNAQMVRNHESGFLESKTNNLQINVEESCCPIFVGWILTHRVYAISQDVYLYYESMRDQLSADNEIFAPVPARIKSNVFSENSREKRVIGVFEASSFCTFYKACYFYDAYNYFSFDIPAVPENIVSGQSLHFPPDFWISIF